MQQSSSCYYVPVLLLAYKSEDVRGREGGELGKRWWVSGWRKEDAVRVAVAVRERTRRKGESRRIINTVALLNALNIL